MLASRIWHLPLPVCTATVSSSLQSVVLASRTWHLRLPVCAATVSSSLQFSPLIDWVVGGDMRDDSAEILFQSFLQEALVSSSGIGQGCPLFDDAHPVFPLPTTASPIFQGGRKNGFGEAVAEGDMPEPCTFLSLDSCQRGSCRPTVSTLWQF